MSAPPPNKQILRKPPPVSLGKPSLRHRLESYYSLVSPDAIADEAEWKRKFEVIYQKFGGTVSGETALAQKLAKKYGDNVRLLVAPPHRSERTGQLKRKRDSENGSNAASDGRKHSEQHYEVDESRRCSQVLEFTSACFDAEHALKVPESEVMKANPISFLGSISELTKLDNISKFRPLLPECDPQRFELTASAPKRTSSSADKISDSEKIKRLPFFLAMAARFENSGPLSLLYSIASNRQRARVMVRYVDCVRGTLTGYLIAFDKHLNMILKDVDEVFGGRVTRNSEAVMAAGGSLQDTLTGSVAAIRERNKGDELSMTNHCSHAPSKAKLEAQRRQCWPPDGSGGPGPAIKQRYFHQLLVRGDNVVMVWRAESERSIHPRTGKSPKHSIYDSAVSGKKLSESKIGTPGSLFYALQRWENQRGKRAPPQHRFYR